MNQFAMSLMKSENRVRWLADERAYIDEWPMTEDQKQAILDRDYNRCLELGGNIYFLAKVFSTDGLSFLQAVGTMTGMSPEDYQAMMIAGGRSPGPPTGMKRQPSKRGSAFSRSTRAPQRSAGQLLPGWWAMGASAMIGPGPAPPASCGSMTAAASARASASFRCRFC